MSLSDVNWNKFKAVLEEIFLFDHADLDFGIYRILNAKRGEITDYLDNDLRTQVREVLGSVSSGEATALKKQLDDAVATAKSLGVEPEAVPKVKELREKLAAAGDPDAIESNVYSHLAAFFRRYYADGDFISQRRYKEGVYAIPYSGEEVKLHWANADQYYIKSTEYFRDYTFKLDGERRVRFKLLEADTELNNNKAQVDRRFMLAEGAKIAIDGNTLVIPFHYRPDAEKRKQKELNDEAKASILAALKKEPLWGLALGKPARDGEDRTVIDKHLASYTARNTFDYFIHRNLGKFLTQELDFFIKNEVVQLDDIENENAVRVETYLSKVKAIRKIGSKIIALLAQIEDFQKRLWLKKKFVFSTDYCIPLGVLPSQSPLALETLLEKCGPDWQAILPDEEWNRLKHSQGSSTGLRSALAQRPNLPIDTGRLNTTETRAVLASIQLDDLQGIAIHGDAIHGLRLAHRRFKQSVRMTYNDPPFNTGNDGFAYKDAYQHSSWLSFMRDRLAEIGKLLTDDGTLYTHIDYNEKERLRLLLDDSFSYITEIIWRIGWLSGYKTKAAKFIRNHDTIYQHAMSERPKFNKTYIPYPAGYRRRDGAEPEGEGYPLEDTWNCSDIDSLNSIQIISFSKEKVGDDRLTQKNENLLWRMVRSSSDEGDLVLDCFLGSGTTAAVAHKTGRHWLGCEVGSQFDDYILPRLRRVVGGDHYGISNDVRWSGGGAFKYVRIESYDDTLNNLDLIPRTKAQEDLLSANPSAKEDYLLKYMLDFETKGSASLLNVKKFDDPFNYKLMVSTGTVGETQEKTVDLVETFNWLLGLRVKHIDWIRDFCTVKGTDPEGRSVLVVWRTTKGKKPAEANADLDTFFDKQGYNMKDQEFEIVYVNGDNHLENRRREDQTWKVRLIEEDFHRLMWDVEDV